MTRIPDIKTAKTFIVIAAPDGTLARDVAMSLQEDKRLLHEKFNGMRGPSWAAMTNHLEPGANRAEIAASLEDVLNRRDRYMMVISGYENTPDWNAALADIMDGRNLAATFIVAEGDVPPPEIRSLFHAYVELPEVLENDPVDWTRTAIMTARQQQAGQHPYDPPNPQVAALPGMRPPQQH